MQNKQHLTLDSKESLGTFSDIKKGKKREGEKDTYAKISFQLECLSYKIMLQILTTQLEIPLKPMRLHLQLCLKTIH